MFVWSPGLVLQKRSSVVKREFGVTRCVGVGEEVAGGRRTRFLQSNVESKMASLCFSSPRFLLTAVAALSCYSIHLLLKASGIVGMFGLSDTETPAK